VEEMLRGRLSECGGANRSELQQCDFYKLAHEGRLTPCLIAGGLEAGRLRYVDTIEDVRVTPVRKLKATFAMTTSPAPSRISLRTNLADYPATKALRDGRISSAIVDLVFCGPKTAYDGFKPMLRDNAFDAGEIAIATFLQAKAHGKPYVLIPAPTAGRLPHGAIVYNRAMGELRPRDIEGARVGVRSYAQTTGVYVRGVLQHDYDVDLNKVTWVTVEDAHVAEYKDPANCERLPQGTSLAQMLLEGKIDAAILGNEVADGAHIARLIPDWEDAASRWQAREGLIPINHMMAIRADIARERPDVVREIYRMLVEGRQYAPEAAAKLPAFGLEANRKALEMAIDWAREQGIIDRPMTVDSLFDDAARDDATLVTPRSTISATTSG
jgi:4,5-dihydroxyphthalate decarboxylase